MSAALATAFAAGIPASSVDERELWTVLGVCETPAPGDEYSALAATMTPTAAAKVAAVREIARRMETRRFDSDDIIHEPEDVAARMMPLLRDRQTEACVVVLMDAANRIKTHVVISEGALNMTVVQAREVFRLAILARAAAVVLVHNHPSGNPKPSAADIALTRKLVEAGALVDIPLRDHIVIGANEWTSLMQAGLMPLPVNAHD